MTKHYRILFEEYDPKTTSTQPDNIIFEGSVSRPKDFMDFGISHENQIKVISNAQDFILKLQAGEMNSNHSSCPKCKDGSLKKHGFKTSVFHDVFSDHNVKIPRKRCNKCGFVDGTSVTKLLGSSLSGELIKIQAEVGANHSYRDSEKLIELFSHKKRSINNHETINNTTELVGASVSRLNKIEQEVLYADCAEELIVHVDGGHINSKEEGERSFEAMTSAVYKPESVKSNKKNTRNYIESKHCAASALFDSQEQMKNRTIIAALKEGLSPQTKITALCDGADNCWNIVDVLEPLSASVTRILDWFHITKRIKNIALPDPHKEKLEKVKWHLWRGNTDRALQRISELIEVCSDKPVGKLKKLKAYIENNKSKIVNYNWRKEQGLPFTSNLAESTVESLINQRCKGQQHMRWSRKGLDPVLQIRAAIASNDWCINWKTIVANV